MLVIPEKFNRNHPTVRAIGSQADTGLFLIEYICTRLERANLAGLDVLDFGCGCRFADAIVNRGVALNSYTGVDVETDMIDFLAENVEDPRLRFFRIDARNPIYNPGGVPMSSEMSLPFGNQRFDLICMYSVITHQQPDDAAAIFSIARTACKGDGRMFFSALVEDGDFGYREKFPETPTALSVYSMDRLAQILIDAGWQILSFEKHAPSGLPNQDTFVCSMA